MKLACNLVLLTGAALVVLAAVVGVRAATWKAPAWGEGASLAPVPKVDVDAAAGHLGEAIRFQTVSDQDPARVDWTAWDGLQAWMQKTYPAAHAAMTRETVARHTLIYTWKGSDPSLPPIVLMAHQDVVPVDPATAASWKRPGFSGERADGAVWGRGAIDDKGALVAILEAADALARDGFKPRRTVYFVFGHDEEVLGSGARAAADLFRARGIRPEFALDEGGFAITSDPITHKPLALIATGEKGYATLRITARGEGGHSSMPPDMTAAQVVARAVDRIASDRFTPRFDGPSADTVRALAGGAPAPVRALVANERLFGPVIAGQMGKSPAGAAMLRTTIAPTMLQGSLKENVLPQSATALINYRLHPRDSLDAVMARARKDVKGLPVELAWEPGAYAAPAVASTAAPGFRLIAAAAREATGALPAPGLSTGADDGRHMIGVARDVYRFVPALLAPEELEMLHGVNERVSEENLRRMTEFYSRLIATAAR